MRLPDPADHAAARHITVAVKHDHHKTGREQHDLYTALDSHVTETRQVLRLEATIMAQMEHENVIRLIGVNTRFQVCGMPSRAAKATTPDMGQCRYNLNRCKSTLVLDQYFESSET